MHAIRSDGSAFNTAVNDVTAVTVHPDGTVWGTQYRLNRVVAINPTTGAQICSAPLPARSGNSPHGVAVDRLGRIWAPSRFGSGAVNVFDTSCAHVATSRTPTRAAACASCAAARSDPASDGPPA